jgi:hypothetical protein
MVGTVRRHRLGSEFGEARIASATIAFHSIDAGGRSKVPMFRRKNRSNAWLTRFFGTHSAGPAIIHLKSPFMLSEDSHE